MTNGFDLTKVMAAMFGRIGWRQPAAADSVTVTAANYGTTSGRYYQDFHSLVTVQNVKSTMEEPGASTSNVNAHLTQFSKAAIMRALSGVFRVKDYIEQALTYDPVAHQQVRTLSNTGLFVGYQISLARDMNIAVQIDGARLLFDTDCTFNLYLFAEGKKTAIATKSVNVVANEATIISWTDFILNYIGTYNKGARFYLGYFQDDLVASGAKAIHEDGCFSKTKVFCATTFQSAKISGQTNFDRAVISETNLTYGINLEISAFRDHTNQIVKNPALFDELVGLTVCYTVIEQILNSTQSNNTERILKEGLDKVGIQLELTGAAPISDGPKVKGIAQRIEAETTRLRSSFYPKPKAQVVNYACYAD